MVPVTVVEGGPCTVTQIRTTSKDGYEAVQVGFAPVKRLNKALRGHLGRTGLFRHLRELPVDGVDDLEVGQQINVDVFEVGEKVDVVGTSKGKGFQGTMKRHGFHGGPAPTASPTGPGPPAPSEQARLLEGSSRARKWPATWATPG